MFIAGFLFIRMDQSVDHIRSRFAFCLWSMGTWMFFPLFGNMGAFKENRDVLEKELKMSSYSLEAFYIARSLLLIPLAFVIPLMWFIAVYWMSNANPHPHVF